MNRRRVLIVDDEPAFTHALHRLLRRSHDVEVASDGQQALDLLMGGARFDVIFSDVMMPKMTGIELFERLVQLLPEQTRHFIFLSGGTFSQPTRARLRALGTRQLEKPVDVAVLRAAIQEVDEDDADADPAPDPDEDGEAAGPTRVASEPSLHR